MTDVALGPGPDRTRALRDRVADELIVELAKVQPPLDADLEAELIALAFAHEDTKVRKKALAVCKKGVICRR